jgi:zinc transport system substrate-binding protein
MSIRSAVFIALLMAPMLAFAGRLQVFVTVAPLAWLVGQVGGEQVAVHSLVKPGQDPHGFEPGPRQIGALQQADAYLSLGLPFERAWLPRVMAQNPSLRLVRLGDVEAEDGHDHHHDGHDHGGEDPHVWTDPRQMQAISVQVRELLSELAPEKAVVFASRQRALSASLEGLDLALARRFGAMSEKVFLVHHPAWGHLAERYGLTQLSIEQDGKEPGPRALAALADEVKRHGITTLFVEPQASDQLSHGLADSLGLAVVQLDPLAYDYEANMRRVAERIAEGQQ